MSGRVLTYDGHGRRLELKQSYERQEGRMSGSRHVADVYSRIPFRSRVTNYQAPSVLIHIHGLGHPSEIFQAPQHCR